MPADNRMTPKQAAEKLGVTRQRVQVLIKTGQLKAEKLITPRGPVFMIDPADLANAQIGKVGWKKGRPRKESEE